MLRVTRPGILREVVQLCAVYVCTAAITIDDDDGVARRRPKARATDRLVDCCERSRIDLAQLASADSAEKKVCRGVFFLRAAKKQRCLRSGSDFFGLVSV